MWDVGRMWAGDEKVAMDVARMKERAQSLGYQVEEPPPPGASSLWEGTAFHPRWVALFRREGEVVAGLYEDGPRLILIAFGPAGTRTEWEYRAGKWEKVLDYHGPDFLGELGLEEASS